LYIKPPLVSADSFSVVEAPFAAAAADDDELLLLVAAGALELVVAAGALELVLELLVAAGALELALELVELVELLGPLEPQAAITNATTGTAANDSFLSMRPHLIKKVCRSPRLRKASDPCRPGRACRPA
jgi:hypothetical protein